jgi:hypothetical protein
MLQQDIVVEWWPCDVGACNTTAIALNGRTDKGGRDVIKRHRLPRDDISGPTCGGDSGPNMMFACVFRVNRSY